MAAFNKKLKFVILQQINVMSLILLQIPGPIENYQYISLPTAHLKRACEVAIFIF